MRGIPVLLGQQKEYEETPENVVRRSSKIARENRSSKNEDSSHI